MKTRKARKQQEENELSGLRLVDEAVHLVRLAPAQTLAAYAIGTLPFAIGLLYFWMDMSYNTFAGQNCLRASLLLTLAFLWMKTWHVIYCSNLMSSLTQQPAVDWTPREVGRVVLQQLALQPTGFMAIPLALLIMIPFGWTFAFYQNLTTLGGARSGSLKSLARDAWRQAGAWPRQNHLVIWLTCPWVLILGLGLFFGVIWLMGEMIPLGGMILVLLILYFITLIQILVFAGVFLCPFGFAVAGNVAMALMLGPYLLKTLFGIETAFNLSGIHSVFNTTFFAAVCVLSYLCLDPIVKACYVLRCFYGAARHTGADLLADLDRVRQERGMRARTAALVMFAITLLTPQAGAGNDESSPPAPPPPELEQALDSTRLNRELDTVISQPEYSWRLPRKREDVEPPAVLESFMLDFNEWSEQFLERAREWTRQVMRRIEDYIESLIPEEDVKEFDSPLEWMTPKQVLTFVLLAAVCSILGITLYRTIRRRRRAAQGTVAVAEAPTVDITSEDLVATQLPSEEWLSLSLELLGKGEFRLAMRALYMSGLAHMAHTDRITIERFKSNRDYLREYHRRAHDDPNGITAFEENIRSLERVWYGAHPVDSTVLEAFAARHQALLPPPFSAREWLAASPGVRT